MDPTALLDSLAECLCEMIQSSRVPDVCFCGVVPGEAPAADYMGDCRGMQQGMAWVRLTAMYPASGVGVVSELPTTNTTSLGLDIEIGMLRPMPPPDPTGAAPTPEQYRELARLCNDDAMVMYRAVYCCEAFTSIPTVLGQYVPVGPQGLAIGGTWPLFTLLE